jgi:hypothetical protein
MFVSYNKVFLLMRNVPSGETNYLIDALRVLAELLPPSWSIDWSGQELSQRREV